MFTNDSPSAHEHDYLLKMNLRIYAMILKGDVCRKKKLKYLQMKEKSRLTRNDWVELWCPRILLTGRPRTESSIRSSRSDGFVWSYPTFCEWHSVRRTRMWNMNIKKIFGQYETITSKIIRTGIGSGSLRWTPISEKSGGISAGILYGWALMNEHRPRTPAWRIFILLFSFSEVLLIFLNFAWKIHVEYN